MYLGTEPAIISFDKETSLDRDFFTHDVPFIVIDGFNTVRGRGGGGGYCSSCKQLVSMGDLSQCSAFFGIKGSSGVNKIILI